MKNTHDEENKVILSPAAPSDIDEIYSLLCASFDREEIRDGADFAATFDDPRFFPYNIIADVQTVGFIGVWELDGFTYIEHFATYPKYRNRGYGAATLRTLENRYSKLILEAEPPTDEIRLRRSEFYKRAGFAVNDCEYLQPPFRASDKPFPLKLLSYPAPFDDISSAIECIYAHVYRTDKDDVLSAYAAR